MKIYPDDLLFEYVWKDENPGVDPAIVVHISQVKVHLKKQEGYVGAHGSVTCEHIDALSDSRTLEMGVHRGLLVKRIVSMKDNLDIVSIPERMRKSYLNNERYGHLGRKRIFSSRRVSR